MDRKPTPAAPQTPVQTQANIWPAPSGPRWAPEIKPINASPSRPPRVAETAMERFSRALIDSRDTGPFGAIVQRSTAPGAPPPPSRFDRFVSGARREFEEWQAPSLPPIKREYVGYGPAGSSAWAQKVAENPRLQQGYHKHDQSDAAGGIKGTFLNGAGAPKCNIFVYDALRSSGIEPPLLRGQVPRARDWADPAKVSGYRVVAPDEPLVQGDIITDGDHMGVYTPKVIDGRIRNMTTSAASPFSRNNPLLGGPSLTIGRSNRLPAISNRATSSDVMLNLATGLPSVS